MGLTVYRNINSDNALKEVRIQELKTIETMAEKYGTQMSPEEFGDYVRDLNINRKQIQETQTR
jgi:hypothetical protein